MAKKFSLLTEYSELELSQLITNVVTEVLQKKFSQILLNFSNSPPKTESIKLLSRSEVCKLLNISIPTLVKLQKKGDITPIIVGGSYKYNKSNIEAFIKGSK